MQAVRELKKVYQKAMDLSLLNLSLQLGLICCRFNAGYTRKPLRYTGETA